MSKLTTRGNVVAKDFYTYPSTVIGIAGGTTANDAINIQADSDFILYKLSAFAIENPVVGGQTTSTRVLPLVTVQITDTGSGRQIFESPVPIPAIFGDGSLPFILPAPRRFASNSVISINYTNISGAAALTYDIYLTFIGVKIYVGR